MGLESTDRQSSEKRSRAWELYQEHRQAVLQRCDRLFAILMLAQWAFAIGLALVVSPYAWSGKQQLVHAHVYAAVLLGGAITSLPVLLAFLQPGLPINRYV